MDKQKIENKWNERRIKSMGNSPQVKGFEDEESSTRRRGEMWRRAAGCALCLHRKPDVEWKRVLARKRNGET